LLRVDVKFGGNDSSVGGPMFALSKGAVLRLLGHQSFKWGLHSCSLYGHAGRQCPLP